MAKKLYKSTKNKMLFGVCGGLAEYFNIDVTICRIIFVLLGLLSGSGIVLYIIAALIMPRRDNTDEDIIVDDLKSANMDYSENKKSSDDDKKKESRGTINKKAHSTEDFDNYFKD